MTDFGTGNVLGNMATFDRNQISTDTANGLQFEGNGIPDAAELFLMVELIWRVGHDMSARFLFFGLFCVLSVSSCWREGQVAEENLPELGNGESLSLLGLTMNEINLEVTLMDGDGRALQFQDYAVRKALDSAISVPELFDSLPRLSPEFDSCGSAITARATVADDTESEYQHVCGLDTPVSLRIDSASPWEAILRLIETLNSGTEYGRAISIDVVYEGEPGQLRMPLAFTESDSIAIDAHEQPARDVLCEIIRQSGLGIRYNYMSASNVPADGMTIWNSSYNVGAEIENTLTPTEQDVEILAWRKRVYDAFSSYQEKLRDLKDSR